MAHIFPKLEHWTEPLSFRLQRQLKQRFIKHHSSVKRATCHTCIRRIVNECVLQYDPYNTDGDCLLEK